MKKFFSLILALMLMAGFCVNSHASQQTVEAEGTFVMGDNDTKTQAKDFALQDAKRLALEQAGTYLRNITQVVNGQVTKDDITTIASGVIKLEKIINEETKFNSGVVSLIIKARFVIDSDDLQKKIETLQQSNRLQEEIQKTADMQNRYEDLLAENNRLKAQAAQTNDQSIKEQLLVKTQAINSQLTATQWYNKGNEYYDAKNFDSAIEAYGKAIAIDPQYSDAYYKRGNSYSERGLNDLAIVDYNKAIQLNPQDEYAYHQRGFFYLEKRQYDLAIADFDKTIQLSHRYSNAYYNRGLSYRLKSQYDLAIADFNEFIQLEPQDADAYIQRGFCRFDKGQYDLSTIDYSKAIQLNPQDADFYYWRGLSYCMQEKYTLALADIDKALELDPQNNDFRKLREQILSSINFDAYMQELRR